MSEPVVVFSISLSPITEGGCAGLTCAVAADRPTKPRLIAQAAAGLVEGLVLLRQRVGLPPDPGLNIAHEALLVAAGVGDTRLNFMKDPYGPRS